MLKRLQTLVHLFCLLAIALLSIALPHPARAYSAQLRRYPYLTDAVGTHALVNWATDLTVTGGMVTWGKAGVESCTAHSAAAPPPTRINVNSVSENQWKASLDGLAPNTRYCYRIFDGSGALDLLGADPSPTFWSQIPAGDSTPFSFAVFGDWGQVDDSGDNPDQANLMRRIANSGARFALTTGDNAYDNGSQANYGDLVQTGAGLSAVFGPQFWKVPGASIPIFPSIGNHGLSAFTTTHPHLVNWPEDQAVASSNGRYQMDTYCCLNGTNSAQYPSAWYAFDAGVARFYVLDAAWSEANTGSTDVYQNEHDYHWTTSSLEYQWLAADLATHQAQVKFVFFHYPVYSDNQTESSDTYLQGPGNLEGLLNSFKVNIIFNGHAHIYQRNRRSSGMQVYTYITGGGGATLQTVGPCSAIDAYGIGWEASACGSAHNPSSSSQVYHFLLVRVSGSKVTVWPTDENGNVFDPQTYNFGGPPDTTPPSQPTNLTATASGPHQINLSWSASTDNVGVTGYTIRRNASVLATVGGTTLTYSDQTVQDGKTYSYTVSAFDAANNTSAPSNAALAQANFLFAPIAIR